MGKHMVGESVYQIQVS